MYSYAASARSSAQPSAVYAVLVDPGTWVEWTGLDAYEADPEQGGRADAVGSVRLSRSGRTTARERVTALEPDRRMDYAQEPGGPLRDYRASVVLTPDAGGTRIDWEGTFRRASVPGLGPVVQRYMRSLMQRFADGLARRAEAGPP